METKIEIVKNMLENEIDEKMICSIVKITKQELEKIKKVTKQKSN